MKRLIVFLLTLGALVPGFSQIEPPSYRPDLWFVKFEPEVRAALPEDRRVISTDKLRRLGIEPMVRLLENYPGATLRRAFPLRSSDIDRIYRLEFGTQHPANVVASCEAIQAHPAITYAEPAPVYRLDFVPNDYDSASLRHLPIINATDAWDVTRGDTNIVVAVVDAAVLTSHPDLAANIWINRAEIPGNGLDDDNNGYIDDWRGWDAANGNNDPNPQVSSSSFFTHGTNVGGCVAAVTDNNTGIAGIGFNTRIMAVKVKSDGTTGPSLDETTGGVAYAIAAGADVINMSYGGGGFSAATQDLINEGDRRGIIFVASAGNTGQNQIQYPAGYDKVVSVGATDFDDEVSNFSTTHSSVDIMAPGNGIRTTNHQTNNVPSYGPSTGTSFSAPITAGTIALMLAVNPCLSHDSVVAILRRTATNIDTLNPSQVGLIGGGRLDAGAAVAAVGLPDAPIADFTYDSAFTCTGEILFELVEPAGCANSVSWNVDGQTSSRRDPTFTFSDSGQYPVTLIVRNPTGADTLSRTINLQVGRIPSVDVGGGINKRDTLCRGEQLQLNASTDATGNFSIDWSPKTGIVSGENSLNPVIAPLQGTTYTLTVTGADGCVGSDRILVLSLPKPTISDPPLVRTRVGLSVRPRVTASAQDLSYRWTPGTFLSDSTRMSPIIRADSSVAGDTLFYQLIGTAPNGCSDTVTFIVAVEALPPSNIERAFAQAGGRLLDPAPQPAGTQVTFRARFDRPGALQLELFDLRGQRVARLYEGAATSDYRLRWQRPEGVSPGIYLVRWSYRGTSIYQRLRLR